METIEEVYDQIMGSEYILPGIKIVAEGAREDICIVEMDGEKKILSLKEGES